MRARDSYLSFVLCHVGEGFYHILLLCHKGEGFYHIILFDVMRVRDSIIPFVWCDECVRFYGILMFHVMRVRDFTLSDIRVFKFNLHSQFQGGVAPIINGPGGGHQRVRESLLPICVKWGERGIMTCIFVWCYEDEGFFPVLLCDLLQVKGKCLFSGVMAWGWGFLSYIYIYIHICRQINDIWGYLYNHVLNCDVTSMDIRLGIWGLQETSFANVWNIRIF